MKKILFIVLILIVGLLFIYKLKTPKTILFVDSNPQGATIIVDYEEHSIDKVTKYSSPARIINLPEGTHEIYAQKYGHYEEIIKIDIKKGENRLYVNLGKIEIASFVKYPSGDKVNEFSWLDDNDLLINKGNQLYKLTNTSLDKVENTSFSKIFSILQNGYFFTDEANIKNLFIFPKNAVATGIQGDKFSISDNANLVAYVNNNNIVVTNPTFQQKNSIDSLQQKVLGIKWSRNNEMIVFTAMDVNFYDDKFRKFNIFHDEKGSIVDSDISPDGKNLQYITNSGLFIYNREKENASQINFDKTPLNSAKAIWINNSRLLLIEKQEKLPYLDRIFIINSSTKEKRFILTSANLIKRIDLESGLKLSLDGKKVAMKENAGEIWVLHLQ